MKNNSLSFELTDPASITLRLQELNKILPKEYLDLHTISGQRKYFDPQHVERTALVLLSNVSVLEPEKGKKLLCELSGKDLLSRLHRLAINWMKTNKIPIQLQKGTRLVTVNSANSDGEGAIDEPEECERYYLLCKD